LEGRGVGKDRTNAVSYFKKAAEHGHSRAQYRLGMAYLLGEGVERNTEQATQWFRKAAKQGETNAAKRLSLAYTIGQGVPQDMAESAKWWAIGHGQRTVSAITGLTATVTGQVLTATAPTNVLTSDLAVSSAALSNGVLTQMVLTQAVGPVTTTASAPEKIRTGLPGEPASAAAINLTTVLAVAAGSAATIMAVFCVFLLFFFKARLTSLESEIKAAKSELAKVNTNLATMLRYVEKRALADKPDQAQVTGTELTQISAQSAEPGIFKAHRSRPIS
jgi:hypothetical protein